MVYEFVIPSRAKTGSRGHSDPMGGDAVNSLSSGKGKGSSSPRDGSVEHIFKRDCDARKSTGKQSSGKGKQSKSWSKGEGKGKGKENNRKSKGKTKGTKGAKGSHKGKTSKTGLSGLENSKSEMSSETQESAHTCPTDDSCIHGGWSPDEWNDGWF